MLIVENIAVPSPETSHLATTIAPAATTPWPGNTTTDSEILRTTAITMTTKGMLI